MYPRLIQGTVNSRNRRQRLQPVADHRNVARPTISIALTALVCPQFEIIRGDGGTGGSAGAETLEQS